MWEQEVISECLIHASKTHSTLKTSTRFLNLRSVLTRPHWSPTNQQILSVMRQIWILFPSGLLDEFVRSERANIRECLFWSPCAKGAVTGSDGGREKERGRKGREGRKRREGNGGREGRREGGYRGVDRHWQRRGRRLARWRRGVSEQRGWETSGSGPLNHQYSAFGGEFGDIRVFFSPCVW